MEHRRIPWAVTFGNHDEDSVERTGMTEAKMLQFLQTYEHNVNADSTPGLTGTSNSQLLVQSSRSKAPAFGLWLIDTGRYAPDAINGQDFAGYPDWDWVRMDQVTWYRNMSIATEQKYGKKAPSPMWGHIGLHSRQGRVPGGCAGNPAHSGINSSRAPTAECSHSRGDRRSSFHHRKHRPSRIAGPRWSPTVRCPARTSLRRPRLPCLGTGSWWPPGKPAR